VDHKAESDSSFVVLLLAVSVPFTFLDIPILSSKPCDTDDADSSRDLKAFRVSGLIPAPPGVTPVIVTSLSLELILLRSIPFSTIASARLPPPVLIPDPAAESAFTF
jgi:hypothetical protein